MTPHRRNFGLDLMRAVAILLVVLAHYFASTPLHAEGLLGVEIFFVLSGFLIGDILIRSLQKEGATFPMLRAFWLKRWFRTLPNYFVFLLLHLVAVFWATGHFQPGGYLYFIFLQNFFQPIQGFFKESWSLAVEEWFYLLFPLFIVRLNRGSRLSHRAMFAAVALLLVVPFVLRCYCSRFWNMPLIQMVVPLRLDTIMYGVMAAMAMNWQPQRWSRMTGPLSLLPASALFLAGRAFIHHDSRLSSIIGFPLIAMGCALAIPFLRNVPRKGAIFPAVVEYVSKVSYSTYLLNIPLFFFIDGLISWVHVPVAIKLAGRLLMVVMLFLLSYVPYRLVETPFLALRERWVRK